MDREEIEPAKTDLDCWHAWTVFLNSDGSNFDYGRDRLHLVAGTDNFCRFIFDDTAYLTDVYATTVGLRNSLPIHLK